MRFVLTVCLVSCLAVAAAGRASADLLDRVKSNEPITIGFSNVAPWAFVDETGALTGHGPEILRHVLSQMGAGKLRGQIMEFGGLINGVRSGRIDIAASGIFVRPDRCRVVRFTTPTMQAPIGFIVPEGNPLGLDSYADFRERPDAVLAVTAGTVEAAYAKQFGLADRQIARFDHISDASLAVHTGRADAAAALWLSARFAAKRWPDDYGLEVSEPLYEVDGTSVSGHTAFAVHPDEHRFVEAVNARLKEFIGTPEHLALVEPFGIGKANLPTKSTAELCEDAH